MKTLAQEVNQKYIKKAQTGAQNAQAVSVSVGSNYSQP